MKGISLVGEGDPAQATAAATRLRIRPRGRRWTHLSLCVLDAVFSIGACYGTTTRTVREYAGIARLPNLLEPAAEVAEGRFAPDEQAVSELAGHVNRGGADAFARQVGNRQRTSTRGGILKAEAAGRFAEVLAGMACRS